jgi:hypothetical protein
MPLDGIQGHYHNKTNTQLSPCEMTILLIIPSSMGVTLQIFGSLSIIVHTSMLLGGLFKIDILCWRPTRGSMGNFDVTLDFERCFEMV